MRASMAMQERVLSNPRITVHLNTGIDDAYGDAKGGMTGLHLVDTATGEKRDLAVRGLFYGIGHTPNSGILGGQIELDEGGYVVVKEGAKTSVEGVFSAGDLHDTEWRQAITAAGSGCMAALSAERYLTANNLVQEAPAAATAPAEAVPVSAAVGASADHAGASAASSSRAGAGNGASSSSSSSAASSGGASKGMTMEEEFNLYADKHRGQFALRKLYHESDRLMVVLYTSPTCGPCRTLKPILNKVVEEYPGKIHFVEIDIAEDPEIAQAGGVNGTPTVQFFKNKDRLVNWPGVKMKREYKEIIDANITKD